MPLSFLFLLGLGASGTVVETSAALNAGPGGVVDPAVRHPLPTLAVAAQVEARLQEEAPSLTTAHYEDLKDGLSGYGVGTAGFHSSALALTFFADVWDKSDSEAVVTIYAYTTARVTVAPSPWVEVPGQTTLSERTSKGIDTARDRLQSKCRDAGESFAASRPAGTEYVSHAGLIGGFTENRSCRTWTNPKRRCYKHECSLTYEYLNPACQEHRSTRATCTYEDWSLEEVLAVDTTCFPDAKSWRCNDPAYSMSTPTLPGGSVIRQAYAQLGPLVAQSLDAAEAAEPYADRPAGTEFLICEKERPAVRQFCSLQDMAHPIETSWQRSVEQHPDGAVDASGFSALRSQPIISAQVSWSDSQDCWPQGLANPYLVAELADAGPFSLVVGDRSYEIAADGMLPVVDGDSVMLGSAFSVRDDSDLIVPYEARIPATCHLVLRSASLGYDDAELRAEHADVEELGDTKLSLLSYQQSSFDGLVLGTSAAFCRMGRLGDDLASIEKRLRGTPVAVDSLSPSSKRVVTKTLQKAQEDGLIDPDVADLFAYYLAEREGWLSQCAGASPDTPLIFDGEAMEAVLAELPATIAEKARGIAANHAETLDEIRELQERAWAIVVVGRLDAATQSAWMGYVGGEAN